MDLIAVASEGVAIGDDTLKDMHVAGFVFGLEPVERGRWLRRIEWARRIDRIGEAQYLDPSTAPLTNEGWQRLRDRAVEAMSFVGAVDNDFAIEAFDRYVKATRDHSGPGLTISTIVE